MVTEFGKILRIIRINSEDSLRGMANKLGISAAYLSSIENGKRPIPDSLYDNICNAYTLSDKDKKKLKESILASSKTIKIDLTELAEVKKQMISKIMSDDIDEETLIKLNEIINK